MTRIDRRLITAVLFGAAAGSVVPATVAGAHGGDSGHVADGLLHPLLGVDHILAMVTVGIVAVLLVRPVLVPAAFLTAMAVGGALGIAGQSLPFAETAIALSVVALGGALAAGRLTWSVPALGLVALAGFAHGHAHGVEAPAAAHPAVYVAGFLVATAALHCSGVVVGFAVRHRPATRTVIGAGVLGAGVALLAGVA